MIRDVAWRGESPYLVPAAKVEAIGDGGRCGSLRLMAVVLRLRGHRALADHWEPCPLNNGPALAAASPSSVASISSLERLNIRSRDAGASGHTCPGRGRTLKPLHDDQGARRAASLSDGEPCGANRQQADLAVWSVV